MKKIVLLLMMGFFCQLAYSATFESSARQVTLLELYSSEGCSSCPPADEWVREFGKSSALWKDFVPVVFHVDYWDGLGWKDPFGSERFTQRQQEYVRFWHGSSLYTPNVVINGKDWKHWYRLKTLPSFKASPGILKAEVSPDGKVRVVFQPKEKSESKYLAHAALLGIDVESIVTRGENSGKNLKHDFVALDYQRANMEGAAVFNSVIHLKKDDSRAKKFGIAVWVTLGESPVSIQATGGYL